jgi:hypothetical protein
MSGLPGQMCQMFGQFLGAVRSRSAITNILTHLIGGSKRNGWRRFCGASALTDTPRADERIKPVNTVARPDGDGRPRIFISYAHSDGDEIAQRVMTLAEEHGLSPWLDKVGLAGGEDW